MIHRILFAADLRDPYKDATSTQLMTENLLRGFREISQQVVLVAMIAEDCREEIRRYYDKMADSIVFVKRITGQANRYTELWAMIRGCAGVRFREEKELAAMIDDDTYLVSHTPTIDAALLCRSLLKRVKPKRYIQYWSDPLALSMLTPEQFNVKRYPLFFIERQLHRFADDIVFGTKTLYLAQKKLFARTAAAKRMTYCDVAYTETEDMMPLPQGELRFEYLGNYYSRIRDLSPFYHAFLTFGRYKLLICGGSDLSLSPTDNITVKKRVPQSEVKELEALSNVEVCLLNRRGLQIPGKVFYGANSDKLILVIVDGPWGEKIRCYLESFRRFVFCDNNVQSILATLEKIADGKIELDKSQVYRLSPAYVAQSIINGGYID